MSTPNQPVVTRYAPSPTGFQHVGGIRTALFAYLWARKNNGTFILRIEDTDKGREVEGAIQHTIDALAWLGLKYDYGPDKPSAEIGPFLQSDRLHIYKKYAQKLIDKGLAYPDPYTKEELETFREEASAAKRPFLFRDHRPDTFGEWDGTTPLRFKVPEIKRYEWTDAVQGKLSAGPEMLDDFILIKADGYPTYNFAHIVDDLEMGVTHVMRGQEFISSTPKFLSLYDALEIPYPVLVTLPPIMAPDGKKKLGKRDGAKDLFEYKADGILPEAMQNFLALIGWNPGGEQEIYSSAELIEKFSIDRIQKSGGAFNEDKLKWINKEYLATKDHQFKLEYLIDSLPEVRKDAALTPDIKARLSGLVTTAFERIHTKTELHHSFIDGEYDWVFEAPEMIPAEMLKWKNDASAADAVPRLQHVASLLQNADFSSPDTIKAAIWPYAEEIGKGEVLWPLRVALTGRERSPDPFTCAAILGQTETLARLNNAIDSLVAGE